MSDSKFNDNIKDLPGYYISPEGSVYSRYDNRGRLTSTYTLRKLYRRSNGYLQYVFKIRSKGIIKRWYIHRLVAETYIPNPLGKPLVCHKNNIRTDNRVENLYWGTAEENTSQMIREGRSKKSNKSLRFVVFSDLHLHDYTKFPTRLDTGLNILKHIAKICQDNPQCIALHCGDLLHNPEFISSPLFAKINTLFLELSHLDWTLLSITGNHTTPYTIRPGSPIVSWDQEFGRMYNFFECIDFKKYRFLDFCIYGVPYLDHNVGLNEYIKDLKLNPKRKNILLLHTDYPGAKDTDGSEVGSCENLNTNLLQKFDLVLIGHIHKPQRLGKKIYMVGAPYQQRRTDRNCEMGYWKIYSDLSVEFVPLDDTPKFIDVESEDQIKDDGNYYTVIAKPKEIEVRENKFTKDLSKTKLVREYMRAKQIKDKDKKHLLINLIKEAEND